MHAEWHGAPGPWKAAIAVPRAASFETGGFESVLRRVPMGLETHATHGSSVSAIIATPAITMAGPLQAS